MVVHNVLQIYKQDSFSVLKQKKNIMIMFLQNVNFIQLLYVFTVSFHFNIYAKSLGK